MQPELTLTWGRSADRDRSLARRWLWATVALTAGAFVIAAAFAPSGSAAPDRGLAWVLFAGSSAHVASTGWLYTLRDVRSYAVTSHLHSGGPAVRLVFGVYLGAVMAHLVVDAGLWRLRDPFPRVFLARRVPYLMRAAPAVRSVADIR
jgi:hypothetical protein